MTTTLFAFDERNYQDCQKAFRGDKNQEYYLGDYTIESGSVIDVRAEKKAVGSCSIVRIKAKSRQFFRRSWSHVREDGTDVVLLWFVKRGSLCLSHQCGRVVAKAGDFLITKSMSPFTIECDTDEDSLHEILHLVVPSHMFRRFLPLDVNAGFTMPADAREFQIAERMLLDVFEDKDELAEHTEQLLIDSALGVMAEAIKRCENYAQARHSLAEKRMQEVLKFIDVHLSDPKLSAAMVAQACGISSRYLSHLFKQSGTSFSALVWDRRLKIANQWLSSTRPGEISIAEIAFRVGFKSPAHFSRLFKRVFKKGPREYRSSSGLDTTRPHQEFYSGSSNSLQ
ncbi:MAG TPA: AraC family transcriptional regulator [Spongiibacteraceae bacterium]|nr:AraC family transcriptional regulator [Spongiibacteraceae bacterium]